MCLKESEKVNEYINKVLLNIKNKEVHEDIKNELICHIEDLFYDFKKLGLNKEQAVKKAVENMGDAYSIGQDLNKIHKGSPDWFLTILTFIMGLMGIFLCVFINNTAKINSNNNVKVMIASFFIGITLAIALYKFDYRKLKKYATYMFIVVNILMFLSMLFGNIINGSIHAKGIDFSYLYVFLICICLPSVLNGIKLKGFISYTKFIAIYLVPILLLGLIPNLIYTVIYTFIFMATAINMKFSLRVSLVVGLSYIGTLSFIILTSPCRIYRAVAFFNPFKDPNGRGYINTIFYKILKGSSPLGKGQGITLNELPECDKDFVFAYIIHNFGWAIGGIIIVMVGVFIIRLFKSSKLIKEDFGKSIAVEISILFGVQFIWSILMTLNLLPIVAIGVPFLSYSGTNMVINMASIGLIMGIYKRRNYPFTDI